MGAGYGQPAAGGERAKLRAADADRDRVAEILNAAYVEGRLSKDEHDVRLESALAARTYAELDRVVRDLPMTLAPAPVIQAPSLITPAAKTNGLAIASLACGLAQFMFGPVTTIPAIVLGHVARRQIRRTGEAGGGLALAGLMLGWVALLLVTVAIVVGLAAISAIHSSPYPP